MCQDFRVLGQTNHPFPSREPRLSPANIHTFHLGVSFTFRSDSRAGWGGSGSRRSLADGTNQCRVPSNGGTRKFY